MFTSSCAMACARLKPREFSSSNSLHGRVASGFYVELIHVVRDVVGGRHVAEELAELLD